MRNFQDESQPRTGPYPSPDQSPQSAATARASAVRRFLLSRGNSVATDAGFCRLMVPHAVREAAPGLGVLNRRSVLPITVRAASPGIPPGCMLVFARVAEKTGFFLNGPTVEFDSTHKIFTNPSDKRTEDYITGRFG